LGCPFGCADAHRRGEWRRTSAEYYEDPQGKRRKSKHNQRLRDRRKAGAAPEKLPQRQPEEKQKIPAALVSYVQRVVSGIERRRVSREEIVEMLAKEKSQHSLVRQRRMEQIIRALHERPP
jgi:ribosome-binding protein aMBF1 (putative translation factor)